MRVSAETDESESTAHAFMREVGVDEYAPLMSDYLKSGRQREQWYINWIKWDGTKLQASARIEGYSRSKTDNDRFHLSIFAAREMEAQLGIIGMHLKLGLAHKTTEVWLLRCIEECTYPITDPVDIQFEIKLNLRKPKSKKILGRGESCISDVHGGLIRLNTLFSLIL